MSISEMQSDDSKEDMKYNDNDIMMAKQPPKGSLNLAAGSYGSISYVKLIENDSFNQSADGDRNEINEYNILDPRDTLQQVSDKIAQV